MKYRTSGFSLVELLVVLMILGLIATIVLPSLVGRGEAAKLDIAEAQVDRLRMAVDTFYFDTGRLPRELRELVEKPSGADGWNGPYVKESSLTDPWKNRFEYRVPGEHGQYDIFSLGADGQVGGEDFNRDITSWD